MLEQQVCVGGGAQSGKEGWGEGGGDERIKRCGGANGKEAELWGACAHDLGVVELGKSERVLRADGMELKSEA